MEQKKSSDIEKEFCRAYFGAPPQQYWLNSCRIYRIEDGELSIHVCLETDLPQGFKLPAKFSGLPVVVTVKATAFPY